jgi:dissimilatory sulfite reductase (desulfoviridin) alpha/beta subunit
MADVPDYRILIAQLKDMSGPRTKRGYDLVHYWTIVAKAAEVLEEFQVGRITSAEAVREACAKVCDDKAIEWDTPLGIAADSAKQCAAAIRALDVSTV